MRTFAEQTPEHLNRLGLIRRMRGRSEYNGLKTGKSRLPERKCLGALDITHEFYPAEIRDSRTGFSISPGRATLVHLNRSKVTWYHRRPAVESLHNLARYLRGNFGDELLDSVIGATHIALARVALQLGFRYLEPDPRIFTDGYRTLMREEFRDLRNRSINTGAREHGPVLVYMPTTDLLNYYGGYRTPSPQQVRELGAVARAETARNKQMLAPNGLAPANIANQASIH